MDAKNKTDEKKQTFLTKVYNRIKQAPNVPKKAKDAALGMFIKMPHQEIAYGANRAVSGILEEMLANQIQEMTDKVGSYANRKFRVTDNYVADALAKKILVGQRAAVKYGTGNQEQWDELARREADWEPIWEKRKRLLKSQPNISNANLDLEGLSHSREFLLHHGVDPTKLQSRATRQRGKQQASDALRSMFNRIQAEMMMDKRK